MVSARRANRVNSVKGNRSLRAPPPPRRAGGHCTSVVQNTSEQPFWTRRSRHRLVPPVAPLRILGHRPRPGFAHDAVQSVRRHVEDRLALLEARGIVLEHGGAALGEVASGWGRQMVGWSGVRAGGRTRCFVCDEERAAHERSVLGQGTRVRCSEARGGGGRRRGPVRATPPARPLPRCPRPVSHSQFPRAP